MSESNNIPVSKAVFDMHSFVRQKLEAANVAVFEALVAMVEYQDPMARVIFGADAGTLQKFATMSRVASNDLMRTGLAIFSLRVASPEFKAVVEGAGSADSMLRVLLESYSERLPITAVGQDSIVSLGTSHHIPVSKAVFETHSVVRKKLEAANFAVFDALVAMVEYRDPMAPAIFGTDADTLKKIAGTSRVAINSLMRTGLSIFSLRVGSSEFNAVIEGAGSADSMLRIMLESYSAQMPTTSV